MSGVDKSREALRSSPPGLEPLSEQLSAKARVLSETPERKDVGAGAYRNSGGLAERPPNPPLKRASSVPVLIVIEDDPDDFMLLKRALNKAGASARVWWAHDVSEALGVLADVESSAPCVCVVLDIQLPGGNGFEVLEQMKKRPSLCPVRFAFLTGMTDRATADRAAAVGADGFFVKPVRCEELIQVARSLQKLAAT